MVVIYSDDGGTQKGAECKGVVAHGSRTKGTEGGLAKGEKKWPPSIWGRKWSATHLLQLWQLQMSLRCVHVLMRMPTLQTAMPNSSDSEGLLLKNSGGISFMTNSIQSWWSKPCTTTVHINTPIPTPLAAYESPHNCLYTDLIAISCSALNTSDSYSEPSLYCSHVYVVCFISRPSNHVRKLLCNLWTLKLHHNNISPVPSLPTDHSTTFEHYHSWSLFTSWMDWTYKYSHRSLLWKCLMDFSWCPLYFYFELLFYFEL